MILKAWLKILSYPYRIIIGLRNLLYQQNIKKSIAYTTPKIISIGNLTLGGTGKTPLALYLTHILTQKNMTIAILSRGYKRSSRGFKIVNHLETSQTVGDEPYLYYQHFKDHPNVLVAVAENRVKGLKKLLQYRKDITVVILDDAFQQRKIIPTINILLTTFDRPFFNDHILPLGYLREPKQAAVRADIILVTKCPKNLLPLTMDNIKTTIKTFYNKEAYPQIFFTHITYQKPILLSQGQLDQLPKTLVLVTGIAFPQPLKSYLIQQGHTVTHLSFQDHHWFSYTDMLKIRSIFNHLTTKEKALITTEKDSIRFIHNPWYKLLNQIPIFYIPIQITFKQKDLSAFKTQLINKLL